jgi:ankyrin repeat protein
MRLLLEKGPDVEAKGDFGRTALHEAALRGHEAVVRLVLEKGADIKAKENDGSTPLNMAARDGIRPSYGCCWRRGRTSRRRKTSEGRRCSGCTGRLGTGPSCGC